MDHDCRWRFLVTGSLTRGEGVPVLEPYEVIVESGIRDPDSPYALRGVGAIARPDADGIFNTSFVTEGSPASPEPPTFVSVFVRESLGRWHAYVVAVPNANVRRTATREMRLDLGSVRIDPTQLLYVSSVD